MKLRAMYFVAMCALGACAVDGPDATESESAEELTGAPASPNGQINGQIDGQIDPSLAPGTTSVIRRCSARSLGICANASYGSLCAISPARWCLPANELPDGSVLCLCQSQSTI